MAFHGVVESEFLPETHVTAGQFAEHVAFLADHYHLVSLRELLGRHFAGASTDGCVAITFDDAYTGVATHALPVLERWKAPATIFVVRDHAETGHAYWWDRLAWLRQVGSASEWAALAACVGATSTAPEIVRDTIVARGGRLSPAAHDLLLASEATHGPPPAGPLTFPALEQLSQHELLEFGCHSCTHAALPLLPEAEQIREIATSYEVLRERLRSAVPILAYPYGLYDAGSVRAARAAGMTAALSIAGRALGGDRDPYTVPRIGIAGVNTVRTLRLRLARLTIPGLVWRDGYHPRLPTSAGTF